MFMNIPLQVFDVVFFFFFFFFVSFFFFSSFLFFFGSTKITSQIAQWLNASLRVWERKKGERVLWVVTVRNWHVHISDLNLFPMSFGASETASEHTIERSGWQSEQYGASKWVSVASEWESGASERANRRASCPVFQSVFFVILAHSASLSFTFSREKCFRTKKRHMIYDSKNV